jgi:pimeloyl-ACP methyl ester carboxylesterase
MAQALKHTRADEAKAGRSIENARERLLSAIPLTERTLDLAGLRTAMLEGGDGPPVILLHGPGEYAAKWIRVLPETHDGLWRYCAFDLDRLREQMRESWGLIKAYNLDRARTAALHTTQQSLMEQFGVPAISSADLERIAVPTTLIWGQHDLATRLSVAEAASKRYGWPLHVIGNAADDPPIEQPEAFLKALGTALGHSRALDSGASQ